MGGDALIERDAERAALETLVDETVAGHGGLVLVAGEAGVGKTRLIEETARAAEVRLFRGAASSREIAYGPVISALRAYLRAVPDGLSDCGPLRPHLALVLPELGDAVDQSDQATVFEAIRCALVAVVKDAPAVVLLDDLQWSDDTTLELLAALAGALDEQPILVVGAYRSDEVPRAHPIRRLRHELRRDGLLREVELEPLTEAGTARLAEQVLGTAPSARLTAILHDRTAGVPSFTEELAAALESGGRLQPGDAGLDLELDADVPLPQTIRDAVLLRAADLSDPARLAAETASVAGSTFDVELLTGLDCDSGLVELFASGFLVELDGARAAFRHPLARDAIYESIPWLRRRLLHREIATAIEAHGGSGAEVAAHWLAARDQQRALGCLVQAAASLSSVHAYRDAARVGRQALDLWPEGERGAERIEVLERHARVAGLAGDLAEAARAQREVVTTRRAEGAGRALADAQRNLAAIYELSGDRERALAARLVAAEAFTANGFPGEASAERLIAAGYLQSAGKHGDAVRLSRQAAEEATRAERTDLRARALGLKGVALAKGGEFDHGLETIKEGLSLALEHELTLEAAEAYQRLGTAHEIAGDYGGARDALATAVSFCETDSGGGTEYTCLSCMAYVLRELGDWDEAVELSEQLRVPGASPDTTLVADGVLGAILAFRGSGSAARPLLVQCLETGVRLDVVSMSVDSAAALAWLEDLEGDTEQADAHCRFVLERWARSEDHHYAVWGLRWASSFFARQGALDNARACTAALATIAADTGHPDVLAALAHALGETALAEGHADAAAEQLERAVEVHGSLEIPFERAQIQLRSAVALAAVGERETAVQRLVQAHSAARRLGAAPLAHHAAAELEALGESIERRFGSRAAAAHENGGLSRRELEVVRLVASGNTNREIADQLVLSTRTVDMHVRNILAKLGCRSRTEAATKAGELGLLA